MPTFRWFAILALFVCLLSVSSISAQEVDLAVEKFGPSEAAAGADVSYSVVLTNGGPDDAVSVVLDDPVPPGMTFVSQTQNSGPAFSCTAPPVGQGAAIVAVGSSVNCTIATLPAGAVATFTFVFNIPADTPPGTTFVNAATATTATFDVNDENNSGVAVTTTPPPPSADLTVSKDGPANAGPGENIVYTITLGNAGPDAAENLSLEDTLPGTLTFVSLVQNSGPAMSCSTPGAGSGGTVTCTAATFASGATAVFTLTANVPADTTSGASFTNTATVTSKNDPTIENDSASTTVTISSADLAITKTGPPTALGHQDISYTITLTNNGPDTATDVVLTDPLPPGTTFVSVVQDSGPAASCSGPSVGANGTVTCALGMLASLGSLQFTLTIDTQETTSITNTATVSAGSTDPNGGNDSASAPTTVTQNANLAVTKSGPPSIAAGANATYSVTVTNNGASTAMNVSLTDAVPANTTFVSATQTAGPTFSCTTPAAGATGTITCNIASLANGASATFSFVFRVSPAATAGTTITNTANVSTTTTDQAMGNNTSQAMTNVTTSADLRVVKSGAAAVTAGSNLTYTVAANNDGPSDAQTVVLTDNVPPNATFVSATQTSGPAFSCTPPPVGGTGAITCTIATFPTGGAATFTFVVQVSPSATTTVTNIATLSSATPDPSSSNNSSTTNTTVSSNADVAVTKSGPAAVTAGNNISYSVTATNLGPSNAAAVTLTDAVPANTTFVSATQNGGPAFNCTPPPVGGTGTINCSIATLNSGATATFTFVFAVNPAATGAVSNTATIGTSTTDPVPANNSSTSTAAIGAGVTDVSITKTTPGTRFPTGQPIPFTITVSNAGPSVAIDTTVTDVLPAGSTFVSATPSQGTCSGTTTVTCNLGVIGPSASATIALVINAPAIAGPLSNTATVSSTNLDSAPANNTSTASGTVFPASEIPTLPVWALMMMAAGLMVVVLLKR